MLYMPPVIEKIVGSASVSVLPGCVTWLSPWHNQTPPLLANQNEFWFSRSMCQFDANLLWFFSKKENGALILYCCFSWSGINQYIALHKVSVPVQYQTFPVFYHLSRFHTSHFLSLSWGLFIYFYNLDSIKSLKSISFNSLCKAISKLYSS